MFSPKFSLKIEMCFIKKNASGVKIVKKPFGIKVNSFCIKNRSKQLLTPIF